MRISRQQISISFALRPGEDQGKVRRSAETPLRKGTGFSLIEILVTVALLSVIILGLVAMFNQTRRAFTSSLTQVDVLESGRAAADLIAREMEQMAPPGYANLQSFFVDTPFLGTAMTQALLDPNDVRTNSIQQVYFLTTSYSQSHNLQWSILGYKILPVNNGIGSLYRYSSNGISTANLANALANNGLSTPISIFTNAFTNVGAFSRIVDGVINFRVRAYDTNGNLFGLVNRSNATANYYAALPSDYHYSFSNNFVPAYVEIELGIVEDRTLARYQAIAYGGGVPNLTAGISYLTNHPGQVHIFRQRIPIRNVNPAAYQ